MPSGHGGSMRVTHGRVRVSMRITSAPRWASWSVQYGPAQTQVKSATRMPSSGGFAIVDNHVTSLLRSAQLVDPRQLQTEPRAENFVVMLPERRRRAADLPRRATDT